MKRVGLILLVSIFSSVTIPHDLLAKSQNISVTNSWIRYKPAGVKVTGAFMDIKNNSSANDILLSASSPIATVEIHESKMEKGVMSMNRVKSITIPKGKIVKLKPGSYHIMLINIKKNLKVGDLVEVTLKFDKAGDVKVKVPVVKK